MCSRPRSFESSLRFSLILPRTRHGHLLGGGGGEGYANRQGNDGGSECVSVVEDKDIETQSENMILKLVPEQLIT